MNSQTNHTITVYVLPNHLHWVVTDENNQSVSPYTDKFGKGSKRGVLLASLLTDDNRTNTRPDTHRFPLDLYLDLCDAQDRYTRPFPQPLTWG